MDQRGTTGQSDRRKHRYARAVGAVCIALGLAVAGCSASSGGKVMVNFTYLWTGPEGKAMAQIIKDFNASQDKITVKGVSNPDQQSQLAAMASASSSFDISDTFGSNVGAWADKGVLDPLDSDISKSSYKTGDFAKAAMDQTVQGGKTYALPIAVHTVQMLYNKTLFKQAGIAGPPATTSQWAADIAKLTKVNGGAINQLGFANPDFTTMGWEFGGKWFDAQHKPTPDQAGNVAAANFYVDNVVQKYGVSAVEKFTSGFGEYASPQNPFYQGKVAMITDGEWQSAFTKQYAPKLDWGVAALPYPDGHPELKGTTQVSSSVLFIPRSAQHKPEAWTFMKYLLSNKSMLSFTHTLANLPARTSLLGNVTYRDLAQFGAWQEALKSANTRSFDSTSSSQQYTTDLTTASDEITLGKKTPQQAFADLAKQAKKYGN
jgi:multiple sugar transport system substrate-binding protein